MPTDHAVDTVAHDGILIDLDLCIPWRDACLRSTYLPAACRKLLALEEELEKHPDRRPELHAQIETYRESIARVTAFLPIHRGDVVYLAQGYFPDGRPRPLRRAVFLRFPRVGGNNTIAQLRYVDTGERVGVPMYSWWRLPTNASEPLGNLIPFPIDRRVAPVHFDN